MRPPLLRRRIPLLLGLGLAVLASGCVTYDHDGRWDRGYYGRAYDGYYGPGYRYRPRQPVIVHRPIYVERDGKRWRQARREWIRERREHRDEHRRIERRRDRHDRRWGH
jgi:hypothetical protein